jgi:hypothetical protein
MGYVVCKINEIDQVNYYLTIGKSYRILDKKLYRDRLYIYFIKHDDGTNGWVGEDMLYTEQEVRNNKLNNILST